MVNTIFYLGTCDTCKRIMSQIDEISIFDLREIKANPITKEELSAVKDLSGLSYEELFNKRARKFKEIKPDMISAVDDKYAELILSEYTFLKRPIIVFDDIVFAGNSKSTIESIISTVYL